MGRSKAPSLPIKALSFCRPTELRGWQRNWIHRGAPRPANPVTCFPPGKVVAPATKGGNAFPRPSGRLYGFRRQRRHLYWRPKGRPPRQRSDTIYLPRAEPSTRPGGVSRSRTEPLAPRAKGPAAPSTLARESGRQPSGIPASTVPIPTYSLSGLPISFHKKTPFPRERSFFSGHYLMSYMPLTPSLRLM